MGKLGVVIRVAKLVRSGLRRVHTATPVQQHERTVIHKRHAERSASFSFAWLGVKPLLVNRAIYELCKTVAVTRERILDEADAFIP